MDPIKQKQIQKLQIRINALKAKGKSTEKLEAELTQLLNPKGNEAEEKGLRVERAQNAASDYCKYSASKGKSFAKDIKACTEEKTSSIISCEETFANEAKKSPEKVEKDCIDRHAKINKPTEEMENIALDYCGYETGIDGLIGPPFKKILIETAECFNKTSQDLADCQDTTSHSGELKELDKSCVDLYAKLPKPSPKAKQAAEEYCREISNNNNGCIKTEARKIAACTDRDVDRNKTPQEIAEDKCIAKSKAKGKIKKELGEAFPAPPVPKKPKYEFLNI